MAVLPENVMLGPYRIAGLLGEGGMGAVYRARDTRLGRDVAVKVLTNLTVHDREKLLRFEQEARAAGMLNHPNLLTIFDVGNAGDTPYVVSELLEGETLRDRLKRGPIAPRRAAEIALGIAHGLAAAHEKGIVHRDLKPENVFGTKDGRVKILDFGIAKLSPTASHDGPLFPINATEPGMVMGTVGYMSPEQVRGEEVDPRSDIFALGAILYEMLAGNRAFQRNTSVETMTAILKDDPPDLTDLVPNLPPAVERLVRRCLEKDQNQRFQSARDLAFNLEVLTTLPAGPPTLTGRKAPGPPPPVTPDTTLTKTTTMPGLPHPTGLRPATQPRPRPPASVPRRSAVSPLLLVVLFLVAAGGAAVAGWYLASRERTAAENTFFRRMTFRRGEVRTARFTPDGETIVYSAAWEGEPSEIFVASRHSPEARPLGIPEAEVLAVSRSAEVAVLLRRDRLSGLGTLARVPLAGGAAREIANDVLYADFSPDGSRMAVIRAEGPRFRLEFPIGKTRYDTPHYIRDVRISPDGTQVAFLEPHGGATDLVLVGEGDPEPIARGWSRGANGLAWAPGGREIWITGTETSAPPALWAVTLSGDRRLVSRLTGSMKLFDISAAGRLLVANGTWRAALHYSPPGSAPERDVSWLDWSIVSDLSNDGRTLLFNETREGGGARSSIYLYRGGSESPVRIGEGYGAALSPDGKHVLCHVGGKLVVLPTGAGQQRELKVAGSFDLGAVWLPDSRRAVVGGAQPKGEYRLLLIDTELETVRPLSAENIWGGAVRPFAVSPDGRRVAGMNRAETIVLYPTDGSLRSTPVRGARKGEIPIQWSADGRSLYVYQPTALPARIVRIDLGDGSRDHWREFAPADPAGVYRISPVVITRNGNAYAYNALRTLNDLYVAEGLR
ncbi:MAG TPA: serine/threonine-protein kinase [Thermoanaerobaculia bacterium]|nr:serine/threonine-protein kinase [Thermoanaerobaculia bacterium]